MQDHYVEKYGPDDRHGDNEARIEPCKVCGTPLLLRPGEDADCGMHRN